MTKEEKDRIYAALAAPFPEHCIQRTDGRVTGRGYDTTGIGYAFITARLNEVVGLGNWRAHRTVNVKEVTTSRGRPAYEAICDITLELGEWQDGNFIPWAEALADGGHVSTSEADARKGSYTNALKKAAAMFGAGRQAYEGTIDDDNIPAEEAVAAPVPRPQEPLRPARAQGRARSEPQGSPSLPVRERVRLTSRQLSAIWAAARKLGYDQPALRAFVRQSCGAQPEFLTREQASAVISSLNARAANGEAEASAREPGQDG